MKILIIEDELLIRQSLCHVARNRGYEVKGAPTGEEGLQIWKSWLPDLVFLDLVLPDQNGFDLIQSISSISSAKVVLMSAYAQYQQVAKQKGAHLFLIKPFVNIFETFDGVILYFQSESADHLSPTL